MPGLSPHLAAAHPRLGGGQRQLIARYHSRPQPIVALAAALNIYAKTLTCELRGVALMPVARQVALWYLLENAPA